MKIFVFLFYYLFALFTADKNKLYIEKYKNIAVIEMKKHKIPASISLAQGLLESDSGQSWLAKKQKNHFGIQCKTKGKCLKTHCVYYNDNGKVAKYRKYPTDLKSWEHHSIFLKRPRYKELDKCNNNYKMWAITLQKCGYARDKKYAEKLIKIIEKYELYKYDN